VVEYPDSPSLYRTDVYSQMAADLISRRAPQNQPFFLSVAPLAPHLEAFKPDRVNQYPNPRPAPRHAGAFAHEPMPRPPSFDEAKLSDKPPWIRGLPPLTPDQLDQATNRYRSMLESLLAVDEMVDNIVRTLRQTGELDETMIIFTSDNGYLLGEHRLVDAKIFPYEESIRVPLVIRGPGIPAGVTRSQLAANIDLAPTILDYADARPGLRQDGVSLRRLIADPGLELGRAIGIRGCNCVYGKNYAGVRTSRYLYTEYKRWRELYDLRRDPYQLRSRHADRKFSRIESSLRTLARQLSRCAGKSCRRRPRLKLQTERRQGGTNGGRPCAGIAIKPRISGKDARSVIRSHFRRDHRILKAVATVRDGRTVTLRAKLPRRCS
jgi:N-acetylglucosamine-6-sulfatase